ncbi:hypothetical protein [Bacillus sp. FJAT-42315]|uniref:hypothetical protein n=1 Tax=Bacillus sp. FJAT-42315 TaxID=2014077 RepID=UPI000C245E86|nr:hypothetical protein [Bacillus sp. FJAT-42315]
MAPGARLAEKRSQLGQPRQAKDEPAERLVFNLLDGLAFDLERLVGGARHYQKRKAPFSDVWAGARQANKKGCNYTL